MNQRNLIQLNQLNIGSKCMYNAKKYTDKRTVVITQNFQVHNGTSRLINTTVIVVKSKHITPFKNKHKNLSRTLYLPHF